MMNISRAAYVVVAAVAAAAAVQAQGLNGRYQGSIEGTPTTLVVQSQGGQLQGEVDASGYRYLLAGQTDGTRAQGQLRDPQANAAMQFRLEPDGSGLVLVIVAQDPFSGQVQELPIRFTSANGAAAVGGPLAGAGPGAGDPYEQQAGAAAAGYGDPYGQQAGAGAGYGQAGGGQLDPRLIGRWTASNTMVSGDASFVSSSSVTFGADGTYLYQDGPAYASGSFDTGSTSISSTGGGGGDRGRWQVQGGMLYTMPQGYGQWQLLGRVYIEGNRALVTYPDGSKTVWNKSY